jgi:hypothetical protein
MWWLRAKRRKLSAPPWSGGGAERTNGGGTGARRGGLICWVLIERTLIVRVRDGSVIVRIRGGLGAGGGDRADGLA